VLTSASRGPRTVLYSTGRLRVPAASCVPCDRKLHRASPPPPPLPPTRTPIAYRGTSGLVSLVAPRATAVCARTGAQLEYENGGAAAAARALCERVAAGSGYRTQYQALPFDFVQRCSLEQQESSLPYPYPYP
jgi:hypothetical protein